MSAAENETRQRVLIKHIGGLGLLHALKGACFDPTHEWETEASLFVLNVTRDTANALMRAFEQNAIVHVDDRGLPRLLPSPDYR